MVEGPGCKLKGEKLRGRVTGQVVKGVKGNAVDKFLKKRKRKAENEEGDGAPESVTSSVLSSPFHVLLGRACTGVQTLGKELFIFFEGIDQCLRVHFLMAGGFRVNGENLDGDGGGSANTPTLTLLMSKDEVTFNKSSTEMRPTAQCQARVDNFKHLDIVGSYFSHKRAVKTLACAAPSRIITDLLLDQDLLPGVGNIIKNEAMFDSRIRPDTKLGDLTEDHLGFLVKMTRDFSMIFYECRRTGKALEPHLKIYRKGRCKVCGGKATTTRLGEDNPRLTSYCPTCQDNDLSKLQGKQTTKNSLLGWVTRGTPTSRDDDVTSWTCHACTLVNKALSQACSVCHTPRLHTTLNTTPSTGTTSTVHTTHHTSNTPSTGTTSTVNGNSTEWACAVCTLLNTSTLKNCSVCNTPCPQSTNARDNENSAIFTSKNTQKSSKNPQTNCPTTLHDPSLKSHYQTNLAANSNLSKQSSVNTGENSTPVLPSLYPPAKGPPLKRSRLQTFGAVPSVGAQSGDNAVTRLQQVMTPRPDSTRTLTQGVISKSQQSTSSKPGVQNPQQNQRVPHAVPVQNGSSPTPPGGLKSALQYCPQHKAPCVIREVRKTNHNKGRMFHSCPVKKCSFFMWADEKFPECEGHGKRCVLRTVLKEGANNGRKFFACSAAKAKQCRTFVWADEYNNVTVR